MRRKADPETMQRNAAHVKAELRRHMREQNAGATPATPPHLGTRERIIRAIRNYLNI